MTETNSRPSPATRRPRAPISKLRLSLIASGVITEAPATGQIDVIDDPITEFRNADGAPVLSIGQIYGYAAPKLKPSRKQARKARRRGDRV